MTDHDERVRKAADIIVSNLAYWEDHAAQNEAGTHDDILTFLRAHFPEPASGWTTITDDPATWPPDDLCDVLYRCVNPDSADRAMSALDAYGLVSGSEIRLAWKAGVRGLSWHPWPGGAA